MLSISNFREGTLLNHHHGIETDESLEIILTGLRYLSMACRHGRMVCNFHVM